MIGKTISHYKILEKLGEGGMGVVYKAEDTKLRRTVALKFLPRQAFGDEEEKARFIREAQAAAALDHPNICTIHEISEIDDMSFITMAYVDGPNLKDEVKSGPFEVERAVNIAIQIAEGLREAHEKNIIHRDIKSANIMLTSKDQAKIMDFGLAKLPGRTKLTRTGTTIGTVAYMSPEQACGEELDHRSDLWSLGVVLYEMLMGRLPFEGDYEQVVMYKIVNDEPMPVKELNPQIPVELEKIIARALRKNRDQRYSDVGMLIDELRLLQHGEKAIYGTPRSKKSGLLKWGIPAVLLVIVVILSTLLLNRRTGSLKTDIRSLAVVDFDVIGGEEADHLAEGLADGISVKLSKLSSVRVVSSDDVRRLREKNLSSKEVASDLGAQFALGGSLLRSGEKIRVTPQLIDSSTGDVIWSELFDREFSDVFEFLDEISLKIVSALEIELDPLDRMALKEKPTESPEAYNHYLKGRHFYYQVTFKDNELSAKEFQRALQIDADYPLALAGLADAYVQRYTENYDYDELWLDEAESLIARALELDSDLAEAYESRAEVLLAKDNILGALEAAEKARDLRPDLDEPYVHLGNIYLKRGERSKALDMFRDALAIRPSVEALCGKGNIHRIRGHLDSAEVAYCAARELNPDHYRPYCELGDLYQQQNDPEKAERVYRSAVERRPDHDRGYYGLMDIHYETGRFEESKKLLRGYIEKYPYNWKAYEASYNYLAWWLGDYEAGMNVLEEAIERNPDRVWPHLLLAHSHASRMSPASEPEKVIELVERALELRPNSSRVLEMAGEAYGWLGDLDKALSYYEQGLEISPGSAGMLDGMALFLLIDGRFEESVDIHKRALQQYPGGATWRYSRLGEALAFLGRSREFMNIMENAAKKYGDAPDFWLELSREQCRAGRYDDAVASCRRALDIKKTDWGWERLGVALWLSGDLDGALSSFLESPDSRYTLGWRIALLKYRGRFDEIDRLLDNVKSGKAEGESSLPSWFWNASGFYASMRRYEDALAVLMQARESGEEIWDHENTLLLAEYHRGNGDLKAAKKVLRDHEPSIPAEYRPAIQYERAVIAAIEGDFTRAIELADEAATNSNWSGGVPRYGALLGKLLYTRGRYGEAIAKLETLRYFRFFQLVCPSYYVRGQLAAMSGSADGSRVYYEKALSAATRAARGGEHYVSWMIAGRCYSALASAHLGDTKRARAEIEFALRVEPEREDIAYRAAAVYALLGDTDAALKWLETAVERGYQELWWAKHDPDLDSIRGLPRFEEILKDWEERIRAITG